MLVCEKRDWRVEARVSSKFSLLDRFGAWLDGQMSLIFSFPF